MTTTIKFVKECTIAEQDFVKVRFNDTFKGFKQTEDGDYIETDVNEIVMYKSKFLAQIFDELPLLALAYARTEDFTCIRVAMMNTSCELKRQLVRDEDSDHDRYESAITDIVVSEAVQKLLDEEIAKAFA